MSMKHTGMVLIKSATTFTSAVMTKLYPSLEIEELEDFNKRLLLKGITSREHSETFKASLLSLRERWGRHPIFMLRKENT